MGRSNVRAFSVRRSGTVPLNLINPIAVMAFFAHTENEAGLPHRLCDHLQSVGALACDFARDANPAFAKAALWAGLLHDLGKYRDEFQAYLREERESSAETHHAVYGAALAFQKKWLGLAFAIAGHHAGLHDPPRRVESFGLR